MAAAVARSAARVSDGSRRRERSAADASSAGMSGEQYALPEAVTRIARRAPARSRAGTSSSLSAADPLNLTGIVTPGPRVPALAGNRVLYRDGVPVAIHAGGQSDFLVPMEPAVGVGSAAGPAAQAPGLLAGAGTAGLTRASSGVDLRRGDRTERCCAAARPACVHIPEFPRPQPAALLVHLERRLVGLGVEVEQRSPSQARLFVERHHPVPARCPDGSVGCCTSSF